jgi:hypothetical protein
METVSNHVVDDEQVATGHRVPIDRVAVIAVRDGERQIGAYVVNRGQVTYLPAVDVTRLATAGMVFAAAATAIAFALAGRHRPPAIGPVTMGPGGWISVKGAVAPPLRATTPGRPWWARALRARRLVPQR